LEQIQNLTQEMRRADPMMFEQYDRLNSVVQENLIGIRTVKAYVRESFEKEKSDHIKKLLLWCKNLPNTSDL